MNKTVKFSPEVRERAVWMVMEPVGYGPLAEAQISKSDRMYVDHVGARGY